MKIELLDVNNLIGVNKLEKVTSPRLFSSSKTIYDPNGILSSDIFGISKGDRHNTFAYIDLKRKFITPFIYYKVLKSSMFSNIIHLVSGQKRYSVIKDPKDPKYGWIKEDNFNGWTGLDDFYNHWDEINWGKSDTRDQTNKSLMMNLDKDLIWVDKWPIVPPAYRDVQISGTVDFSDRVDKLNNLYVQLIRSVASLAEGGIFARKQYAIQKQIQDKLVEIFDFFKDQISKKSGLIRKNLLGKSVDWGVRSVISSPSYNIEHVEDNIIDIEHSAVPIYQCCSLFYPFIEAWVKNKFSMEIMNNPNMVGLIDPKTKQEVRLQLKDPEVQFSDKNIKKLINDYCLNPENRFKILTVKVFNPANPSVVVDMPINLKGKMILENNVQKELNRPMTITDLLYLACYDVCKNRHIMVSRYPVGTDKGIYLNKINVRSTIKTCKVIINGTEYPFYPLIDLDTLKENVSNKFIDTLVYSNSHLDGMGADLTWFKVEVGYCSNTVQEQAGERLTSGVVFNTANGRSYISWDEISLLIYLNR